MAGALAEMHAVEATGVWNVPIVARRKTALVEKGVAQGWLIPSQDLKLGRIIGAGTFGQTYEAEWHGVRVRLRPAPLAFHMPRAPCKRDATAQAAQHCV